MTALNPLCTAAMEAWRPTVILGQQTAAGDSAGAPDGSDGFLDIVFSGGILGVAIVVLLFALSVSAAYLIFDQIMTLRKKEILPEGLSDAVRQALLTGRVPDADAACRRQPSVLSFALLSGLAEVEYGWREVEKAVEDGLADQSARLMRRVEYLSVIGNIAPMVGLLGTVTGMIFAFQQVAGSQGAAGAGDLAEGIYQALVTTVGGLVVAIPSLAAYAVFRNRVDSLIAESAYQSQHALAPVKRRPPGRSGRAAGPPKPPPSKPPAGGPASRPAAGASGSSPAPPRSPEPPPRRGPTSPPPPPQD
ncbi:MotA/TolQ/ExbB proton channel family protein [Roseimaritima sediminicola]|uniref:MotA/TolQ/ExbB proton channel family protein n=1 Tax=Roseimaritima sediminicola TaxID=2662066 RepID=UPI001F33D187|nr:MotA/TolQ/ExbB proton channel family protein [Roseimaritima sediminicola]